MWLTEDAIQDVRSERLVERCLVAPAKRLQF